MRDLETISIAVTAAEMGILVMATLHTNGAAAAVDRMVCWLEAALTATAPGTGTDPSVASNNSVRSYPFYINAGQNLNTNGVTYLGSESVFGAEWNTQFRIDTAGVWLIVAQLPFNQTSATTAFYSVTITTALTGTPSASTTKGPLYSQKLDQYKRPGLYAAVLNITSVPFSFRFANYNVISVVKNVQPSRAQLQYLEITRLA